MTGADAAAAREATPGQTSLQPPRIVSLDDLDSPSALRME